jgi:hypothetical protein
MSCCIGWLHPETMLTLEELFSAHTRPDPSDREPPADEPVMRVTLTSRSCGPECVAEEVTFAVSRSARPDVVGRSGDCGSDQVRSSSGLDKPDGTQVDRFDCDVTTDKRSVKTLCGRIGMIFRRSGDRLRYSPAKRGVDK